MNIAGQALKPALPSLHGDKRWYWAFAKFSSMKKKN